MRNGRIWSLMALLLDTGRQDADGLSHDGRSETRDSRRRLVTITERFFPKHRTRSGILGTRILRLLSLLQTQRVWTAAGSQSGLRGLRRADGPRACRRHSIPIPLCFAKIWRP